MTELTLSGEISPFDISANLVNEVLAQANGEDIRIKINSHGGSIFEGLEIFNTLAEYEGRVEIVITSLAASMASVIALAGDSVKMFDNAVFMIHNPWTMAAGESEDLRKMADVLDLLRNQILDIYERKTGADREFLAELMDDETHMNAVDAKELGFIDEIIESSREKALFKLEDFSEIRNSGLEVKFESGQLVAKLKEEDNMETGELAQTLEEEVLSIEPEETVEDDKQTSLALEAKDEEVNDASQSKVVDESDKQDDIEPTVTEDVSEEATEEEVTSEGVNKFAAYKKEIVELKNQLAVAVELKDEVIDSRDAEIERLKGLLDQFSAGVTKHVAGKSTPAPANSHKETFKSLKGAEKTAYFRKYKNEILANK